MMMAERAEVMMMVMVMMWIFSHVDRRWRSSNWCSHYRSWSHWHWSTSNTSSNSSIRHRRWGVTDSSSVRHWWWGVPNSTELVWQWWWHWPDSSTNPSSELVWQWWWCWSNSSSNPKRLRWWSRWCWWSVSNSSSDSSWRWWRVGIAVAVWVVHDGNELKSQFFIKEID